MDFRKEIAKLCAMAHEVLASKPEISDGYIKGLCWLLEGQSIEDVRKAFKTHLKQSSRLPDAAELIKIIEGSPREKQKTFDDSAILAANEAWDLLGRPHRRDRAPQKIKAVIRTMGGWEGQRMVEDSDEPWWKKRFVEAYRALSNDKAVEMLEDNSGSVDNLVDGLVAEKLEWRK